MNNKDLSAGTAAEQRIEAEETTSSQTNANALVGRSLSELFKDALLSFGTTRSYWCTKCGCHVIHGHKEYCELVIAAINLFGRDWVEKNVQVEEWDNYAWMRFDTKLNTKLK